MAVPILPLSLGKLGSEPSAQAGSAQEAKTSCLPLSFPCSSRLCCLPVEEIQDDFRHAGGELEVEFRGGGGTGAIALCQPSPDEQQERCSSQHASDAHGYHRNGQLERKGGHGWDGSESVLGKGGGIASHSAESRP